MTEEEFKETEVYKLLMNDIEIKFGTMVYNLLPPFHVLALKIIEAVSLLVSDLV